MYVLFPLILNTQLLNKAQQRALADDKQITELLVM